MSQLPRQILLHGAGGFLVATLFVAGLVVTAPGEVLLGAGIGPILLLWLFCGMTFAAALIPAVLEAPEENGGSGVPVAIPVRVRRR